MSLHLDDDELLGLIDDRDLIVRAAKEIDGGAFEEIDANDLDVLRCAVVKVSNEERAEGNLTTANALDRVYEALR